MEIVLALKQCFWVAQRFSAANKVLYNRGFSPGVCLILNYAQFLNTRAEFFDPNAMQLQTACSIACFRPASGT